jgi:hypothetical protein
MLHAPLGGRVREQHHAVVLQRYAFDLDEDFPFSGFDGLSVKIGIIGATRKQE